MPTPIMHLALAEEILHADDLPPAIRRLLIRQRGPFLLGNTAPDVQTISGQRRQETHFCTVPRTTDRPTCEALFAAHPQLAHAESLHPAHVAFITGYLAHLALDELWLAAVYERYFLGDWGTRHEQLFLHNVLRTWMDARDQQRLNGDVDAALRETMPQGWLPFVDDEHLRALRDWLVGQLGPGCKVQTAEVFARRMGIPVAEIETALRSPRLMEERIFGRISRAELESFHDTGYARSIASISRYLGKRVFSPTISLPVCQSINI